MKTVCYRNSLVDITHSQVENKLLSKKQDQKNDIHVFRIFLNCGLKTTFVISTNTTKNTSQLTISYGAFSQKIRSCIPSMANFMRLLYSFVTRFAVNKLACIIIFECTGEIFGRQPLTTSTVRQKFKTQANLPQDLHLLLCQFHREQFVALMQMHAQQP